MPVVSLIADSDVSERERALGYTRLDIFVSTFDVQGYTWIWTSSFPAFGSLPTGIPIFVTPFGYRPSPAAVDIAGRYFFSLLGQ